MWRTIVSATARGGFPSPRASIIARLVARSPCSASFGTLRNKGGELWSPALPLIARSQASRSTSSRGFFMPLQGRRSRRIGATATHVALAEEGLASQNPRSSAWIRAFGRAVKIASRGTREACRMAASGVRETSPSPRRRRPVVSSWTRKRASGTSTSLVPAGTAQPCFARGSPGRRCRGRPRRATRRGRARDGDPRARRSGSNRYHGDSASPLPHGARTRSAAPLKQSRKSSSRSRSSSKHGP